MLNSSLLPLYCSKYDMQSIWSVVVHFCSLISESNNRKCIIRMLPIYTYVESYLSLVFEHDTFCEFGSIAFRPSALYMNWIPDYFLNGFYICTRDPLQRWSGHSSEKHFHTNQRIELWGQTNAPKVWKCPNKGTPNERMIGLVYTTGQTFGIITIFTYIWKKSLLFTNAAFIWIKQWKKCNILVQFSMFLYLNRCLNVIYFCDQSCIFSIITPVFSVTWSSENILIYWFDAQLLLLFILGTQLLITEQNI